MSNEFSDVELYILCKIEKSYLLIIASAPRAEFESSKHYGSFTLQS